MAAVPPLVLAVVAGVGLNVQPYLKPGATSVTPDV